MAKLIVPTMGYRMRGSNGKISPTVHLKKESGDTEWMKLNGPLTICKFIIREDTPRVELKDVKPKDICQKCLGAMRAVR